MKIPFMQMIRTEMKYPYIERPFYIEREPRYAIVGFPEVWTPPATTHLIYTKYDVICVPDFVGITINTQL